MTASALFVNFKADLVARKILKKEPEQDLILKLKLIAAVLCVIDFAFVMIFI